MGGEVDPVNYYERHIGDYLKDTAHLSLLEHGIYTRLLDVYYTREGAIDEGMAARLVGARSEDELAALRIVLTEFFVLQDGAYMQTRCDKEITRFKGKQAQAQRAAAASVAARQAPVERPLNARSAPVEPALSVPSNQTPVTKEQKTSSAAPKVSRFDDFWNAYPRKVGKDAARKAFERRKPGDELLSSILSAIETQARGEAWRKDSGQFIPHPATWLNEGRWQDEAVSLPPEPLREVFKPPPRMTPEEREASDKARRAVMSTIKTIGVAHVA